MCGVYDDDGVGVVPASVINVSYDHWKLLNDWPKSPSEIDLDIANLVLGPLVITDWNIADL